MRGKEDLGRLLNAHFDVPPLVSETGRWEGDCRFHRRSDIKKPLSVYVRVSEESTSQYFGQCSTIYGCREDIQNKKRRM